MSDRELLAEMLSQLNIGLDEEVLDKLIWFRDELLRWNKKINLTAITNPFSMLEKHLVDSLTLSPYLKRGVRLLDMGSGGGFPSIPLKIAEPALCVWSVDSVAKKITFQKHVVRTLNLYPFEALHARLEALPQARALALPAFDVIVTRAFAPLKEILALAAPLLSPTGQVIAMKGSEGLKELDDAKKKADLGIFECSRFEKIMLPHSKAQRTLLFFEKNSFKNE